MLSEPTFMVTHTGCGEETNVAAVDIDATRHSATVTGTITGTDGSMTAELEQVTYDEETDELRVRVTTTERSGDMFPQCLTGIDYEAELQFLETLPGRVVVEHRSLDSVRPVARVAP